VKCLVVVAHPLSDSLCHALAHTAIEALGAAGHQVEIEDLCQSGFPPALTAT
jgi:putative NADPH-quinone reductase